MSLRHLSGECIFVHKALVLIPDQEYACRFWFPFVDIDRH